MRLRPEQLGTHLAGSLAPAYLIAGDEPLLVQEAADAIRAAARARGFSERDLYHADARFDWNQLRNDASSLSLFAERKVLEVRLPSGKPGKDGSEALLACLASDAGDTLLLVITGKLDPAGQRSKWLAAIEAKGVVVQIWPVSAAQMPHWIGDRLRRAGIRASDQATQILADRVEGNLLAAVQEIEKLKLLLTDREVDAEVISTVVADSARFNVFGLVDRMLEGDPQGAARHLRGLRQDGTDATVVLWAIARELRTLISVQQAVASGMSGDAAMAQARVWKNRQALVKSALRRLRPRQLRILLHQAGAVDRAIKGIRRAAPWEDLTALVLGVAGCQPLSGASLRLSLTDHQ